jgi:hypothetical protein
VLQNAHGFAEVAQPAQPHGLSAAAQEVVGVEFGGAHDHRVAGRYADHAIVAEAGPQSADVGLDVGRGRPRRVRRPQDVDQAVD